MDEIRPWLFIGDYEDTRNKPRLDTHSIRSVLQLEAAIRLPDIHLLYIPVRDFSPIPAAQLKQGVEFVLAEKEKGNKILVACAAGINRSSAFCTATLKEAEGLSLLEAFREVKTRHRIATPNEFVWQSLCQYYHEDVSYVEVMRLSARIQFGEDQHNTG
jgi:protein-tyrosine phosphatase